MTKEQINAAIAEACGWKIHPLDRFLVIDPRYPHSVQPLSYYCTDLNAMHEAEKVLTSENWDIYCEQLGGSLQGCAHATSRQRAEAFLRTLGKWEEAQG